MESIKSAKATGGKNDGRSARIYHRIAVYTVLAGAGGSLGFTIYAGRHNSSFILILLFAAWVVSPFIALLLADAVGRKWSVARRVALHSLMVLLTAGSLIIYSGLWRVPDQKPAFVFLVVPLLSWFVMGTAVLVEASLPNKG